jgi:predicted dehydrogenase
MKIKIGVIGCGNIFDAYIRNAVHFRDLSYVACADLNAELAQRKASLYGLDAMSIDAMLGRENIDVVLNLTVPNAHAEVSLKAIAAGKHVYTEKPLAVTLAEGAAILDAARQGGVRVGSAPDTILGPAVQSGRAIVDSQEIGKVVSGLATVQSHGMEHWHPNPGFFYKKGGGPVLDVGPYYVSTLVNLLGPVTSVKASGTIGYAERVVTTEGPTKGDVIKVETYTTLHAMLSFASGPQVTLIASWDVWNSDLRPIELHGTEGTLRLSDPNSFSGELAVSVGAKSFRSIHTNTMPFGAFNRDWVGDGVCRSSCYRGLGLADMASAIEADVTHRCNGEFAFHVLETMLAIEDAAASNRTVNLMSSCSRPPLLTEEDATRLIG